MPLIHKIEITCDICGLKHGGGQFVTMADVDESLRRDGWVKPKFYGKEFYVCQVCGRETQFVFEK